MYISPIIFCRKFFDVLFLRVGTKATLKEKKNQSKAFWLHLHYISFISLSSLILKYDHVCGGWSSFLVSVLFINPVT